MAKMQLTVDSVETFSRGFYRSKGAFKASPGNPKVMSGMRLIEQRITAHAEPPRLSRSVADPSDPLHGAVPMPGSIVTVAHRGPTLPTW
jgi:hypothetical protein